MTSWLKLVTISVFMFLLIQVSIPWINASSDNPLSTPLTEAEKAFSSSYEIVSAAEEAGANVSSLIDQLNVGGDYLSEAYVWYRLGNSENANHFASLCYNIAENVRSDALALRDKAKSLRDAEFVATAFGSAVGVIVVVVSCFVVWRIFKYRYRRQVLGLKPEVIYGES